MTKLPVVAAVPNFNMGEQLGQLLPCLSDAGYDEIYVLDDGSSDDSLEITKSTDRQIHFIGGEENKGAGANRNRILNVLGYEATIHFIDADSILDTKNAAEVIAEAVPDYDYGFVGGLVKTQCGRQATWNYGPRQSIYGNIGGNILNIIESIALKNPVEAARIHRQFPRLLADWPNPSTPPERRQVFWVVEQNMVVNSKVFGSVNGFDETLREHEVQDLAIRMAARGLKCYFDPSFATTHMAADVRPYNRQIEKLKAELAINRKHGFKNWFIPNGSFRPILPE